MNRLTKMNHLSNSVKSNKKKTFLFFFLKTKFCKLPFLFALVLATTVKQIFFFFYIVLSNNRQLCPDFRQEQRDILFHFNGIIPVYILQKYGHFPWPALVIGLTTCYLSSYYHSKMALLSDIGTGPNISHVDR